MNTTAAILTEVREKLVKSVDELKSMGIEPPMSLHRAIHQCTHGARTAMLLNAIVNNTSVTVQQGSGPDRGPDSENAESGNDINRVRLTPPLPRATISYASLRSPTILYCRW
jgi:hypothetical protein